MEIGFDKEIDALLRKARGGGAVIAPDAHLDADTIAAFAENALPSASRLVYVKHLADCDRCRRILANVSLANTESDAVEQAPVVAPIVEKAAAPWWSSLFGRGGLAVAFGAILLSFVGGIAVLIIQRGQDSRNASVARVEEYQTTQAPASMANANTATAAEPNANVVGNIALPSANASIANVAAATNGLSATSPLSTPATRLDSAAAGVPPVEDKPVDRERFAEAQPKTADAEPPAPPPPATAGSVATQERKTEESDNARTELDDTRIMKKRSADAMTRDAPAAPAAKGPVRSHGPLQNAQANRAGELSVTRRVGGRTFVYRDGVYYDTAYGSQGTQNFVRGTKEFDRLDAGLRSIANTLGGTVVVVWKGKAYRIN